MPVLDRCVLLADENASQDRLLSRHKTLGFLSLNELRAKGLVKFRPRVVSLQQQLSWYAAQPVALEQLKSAIALNPEIDISESSRTQSALAKPATRSKEAVLLSDSRSPLSHRTNNESLSQQDPGPSSSLPYHEGNPENKVLERQAASTQQRALVIKPFLGIYFRRPNTTKAGDDNKRWPTFLRENCAITYCKNAGPSSMVDSFCLPHALEHPAVDLHSKSHLRVQSQFGCGRRLR